MRFAPLTFSPSCIYVDVHLRPMSHMRSTCPLDRKYRLEVGVEGDMIIRADSIPDGADPD